MYRASEKIVLASGSPRRQRYLTELGVEFDVFVPRIDETPRAAEQPCRYVARMAQHKGTVAQEKHPHLCVIAADTTVYIEDAILGKPRSDMDAVEMLMRLRGREHCVATAFTLACRKRNICYNETVVTHVRFCRFTEREAWRYVETGESADKAGAYGIQGLGGVFVEEIKGSYTNVVGLPLCEMVVALQHYGIVTPL
ncbi:MAG: nucleoside triphosphate pyrophosphatase [Desulfopila sp.]